MARPTFKPTAAQKRQVSIAAGGGMSHESIAMVLGVSRNTLEKHFAKELSSGAYVRRFEAMQGLHAAAKKGNVSAVKAYLAGVPEFMPPPPEAGAAALPASPATAPKPPAPLAQPLGKKEAAQELAKTVQIGTGWDGLLPGATPLQ